MVRKVKQLNQHNHFSKVRDVLISAFERGGFKIFHFFDLLTVLYYPIVGLYDSV